MREYVILESKKIFKYTPWLIFYSYFHFSIKKYKFVFTLRFACYTLNIYFFIFGYLLNKVSSVPILYIIST